MEKFDEAVSLHHDLLMQQMFQKCKGCKEDITSRRHSHVRKGKKALLWKLISRSETFGHFLRTRRRLIVVSLTLTKTPFGQNFRSSNPNVRSIEIFLLLCVLFWNCKRMVPWHHIHLLRKSPIGKGFLFVFYMKLTFYWVFLNRSD